MKRLTDQTRKLIIRMRDAPRYVSVPVGVGLIIGGTILAPLPVFGFWMAPIGVAILAPHSPAAQRLANRMRWWPARMLKWGIRHNLVRIKRVRPDRDQSSPPSED